MKMGQVSRTTDLNRLAPFSVSSIPGTWIFHDVIPVTTWTERSGGTFATIGTDRSHDERSAAIERLEHLEPDCSFWWRCVHVFYSFQHCSLL